MVSDICVIMTNRGDQAPHSYCTIDRNLNKGTMVSMNICESVLIQCDNFRYTENVFFKSHQAFGSLIISVYTGTRNPAALFKTFAPEECKLTALVLELSCSHLI